MRCKDFIMIRIAEKKDIEGILKLAKEFAGQTAASRYVEKDLMFMIDQCMLNGFILVADKDGSVVGALAGFFIASPLMGGVVFSEAAWYVTPEHRGCGKELFDEMERIVKESDAVAIVVAADANEYQKVVERMYAGRGYSDIEHHWLKKLER